MLIPELVYVPAGNFLMGSDPQEDKNASKYEQPQHTVYLPGYYIGKTPMTNAQYRAFVQATGHTAPYHWEHGLIPGGKDNHPVVYVSWKDAVAYCDWLNAQIKQWGWSAGDDAVTEAIRRTRWVVRLPSETEWEKAARGTDGRRYPWGNSWDPARCNTGKFGIEDTTPVGRYSPAGDSPYGCVDMAGNVWEWTHTLWGEDWVEPDFFYPYRDDDGRENPAASGRRILRGGSGCSSDSLRLGRCAARFRYWVEGDDLVDGGFRVCVAAPFSPSL